MKATLEIIELSAEAITEASNAGGGSEPSCPTYTPGENCGLECGGEFP